MTKIKGKLVTELTTYEKFLRLPKIIKKKIKGVELEFSFDIYFSTAYNDECSIEYNMCNAFGDYEGCGLHWRGTFEECVCEAYKYFHVNGGLIEDENNS